MKQVFNSMKGILVIAFFLGAPLFTIAQGGFDDNVNDNPVPFDGGVSLLVAAGIGYGLKKANDRKKANKAEENKM